MKKSTLPQAFKRTSLIALAVFSTLGFVSTYAGSGLPPTPPGSALPVQDTTLEGSVAALNKNFNTYFYSATGDMLPSFSNNAQLNTLAATQKNADLQTQGTIDSQLKNFAFDFNKAYKAYYPSIGQNITLPNPNTGDLSKVLTQGTPSWDTIRVPKSMFSGSSEQQQAQAEYTNNAKLFNFDSFFNGSTEQSNQTSSATPTASYVDYVMQTYQPLLTPSNNPAPAGSNPSANENLVQLMAGKIQSLLKSDLSDAQTRAKNQIKTWLGDPDFQSFWLALRSYEAQNSLLLSNFNFLKAERTPQQGLGKAYNMPTANVSPMQVEDYQVNSTVFNPKWYNQMKTAKPIVLQREQLYLTSLLVRLQYKNQLLNERLLATQSMTAKSSLDMKRQLLTMQEMKLKNKFFGGNDGGNQSSASATNTSQYIPAENNSSNNKNSSSKTKK